MLQYTVVVLPCMGCYRIKFSGVAIDRLQPLGSGVVSVESIPGVGWVYRLYHSYGAYRQPTHHRSLVARCPTQVHAAAAMPSPNEVL